ncbi:MAG: ABC transporter permease subunit, partial [Haloarculaceae archaeon]
APAVASQGAVLDQGLYRVGVTQDSPYYEVVSDDATFVAKPNATTEDIGESVELVVDGGEIVYGPSPKSRAAMEELRSAVKQYNYAQLRQADNQTAAFPVTVRLQYRDQSGVDRTYRVGGTDRNQTRTPSGGGNGTDSGTPTDGTGDTPASGPGDGTPTGGTDGTGTDGTGEVGDTGGLGSLSSLSGGTTVDSPSQLSPPFPFGSLVLAFVFIIPLNFLIQAYGSTILSERLNRRGELLLVSPVSKTDIIAGKTLPYFAAAMGVEAVIAAGVTYVATGSLGGLVAVAAVTPLVVLFLAATFVGAMFARSFKELTFVTVTITVGLTSYAFVPAIFTDVTPIALISPLTIVVRSLQQQAVTAPQFLFSTTPPLLSALVLFGLGAGLYREEDMFAQRSIPLKVLDALAGRIRKRWHVAALVAVLLPFVFVLELLAIALLFALGEVSIPLLLVAVAVIEEIAKSLPIYAAYAHSRFERSVRSALALGFLSGLGFFVGEKLTHVAQLVGLPDLQTGQAALQLATGEFGTPALLALFLAPLVLHAVTATVSALGATRDRRSYVAALALAIAI